MPIRSQHLVHRALQGLVLPLVAAMCIAPTCVEAKTPPQADAKPNIIFILADDLGYGDVGALYQNNRPSGDPRIETPFLDEMANDGMTLTQNYSAAPVCAPSRASIIMGVDQGHSFVRDDQFDQPLPPNYSIGSVLQAAGYYTVVVGKWGFGTSVKEPQPHYPACPLNRGFDAFFGFESHQDAHSKYPGNHGGIFEGCKQDTRGLTGLYTADMFTAKAKQIIIRHQAKHPDRPFFLYLAYTAPHFDMKLPAGPYPKGLGVNGGDRWPLNKQTPDSYIWPGYKDKNWPKVEKIDATMIHRMDRGIGDIRQTLRDLGIAKNTIVIFTSDNGPNNEAGQDPRFFQSWGPFDGIKRDVLEGGAREPTFVDWPGHIMPGSHSDILSAQFDWMPTFTQAAGLPAPARTDGVSLLPVLTGHPNEQNRHTFIYSEYRGNMAGPLTKTILARHGYERRGQEQSIHIGHFVGLRYNTHSATDSLRLYDESLDPKEWHDLAHEAEYKKLLARMQTLLVTSRTPWVGAPRPYDDALLPSVPTPDHVGSLTYRLYEGRWPWIPDFNGLTPLKIGHVGKLGLPHEAIGGVSAFGVELTGFFKVPQSGRYVIKVNSDSGTDVWVHDDLVINDDYVHSVATKQGVVRLDAGWHPIRVAYRHSPGSMFGKTLQIGIIGPEWNYLVLDSKDLAYGHYEDAPVKVALKHAPMNSMEGGTQ